jgi:translation initiation factor IF-2
MIAGLEYGKVKQIVDDQGNILKEATPSTPVEVLGLSGVPDSGAKQSAHNGFNIIN